MCINKLSNPAKTFTYMFSYEKYSKTDFVVKMYILPYLLFRANSWCINVGRLMANVAHHTLICCPIFPQTANPTFSTHIPTVQYTHAFLCHISIGLHPTYLLIYGERFAKNTLNICKHRVIILCYVALLNAELNTIFLKSPSLALIECHLFHSIPPLSSSSPLLIREAAST